MVVVLTCVLTISSSVYIVCNRNWPFFYYLASWNDPTTDHHLVMSKNERRRRILVLEGVSSPQRFAGLPFVVLLGESAFVKKTQTPCYYKSFEVLNHCERLLHSMYSYRAIGAASAVSRKRRLESFELAASFTSSEESRRRSGFEHLFFQIRNRVSLKYS